MEKQFLKHSVNNDLAKAQKTFDRMVMNRIAEKIDAKRSEVASSMLQKQK